MDRPIRTLFVEVRRRRLHSPEVFREENRRYRLFLIDFFSQLRPHVVALQISEFHRLHAELIVRGSPIECTNGSLGPLPLERPDDKVLIDPRDPGGIDRAIGAHRDEAEVDPFGRKFNGDVSPL
jgi:hypothetical protein